ncbi:type II secretion system protein [bacterium]|nr:type II secretion system protein [bacterium]
MRKNFNSRGLTLLEVAVAIMLFAFVILSMGTAFMYAVKTSGSADMATEATLMGERKLEELRLLPFDNITDGSEKIGDYSISWDVTTVGLRIKIVHVRVHYVVRPNEPHNIDIYSAFWRKARDVGT